MYLSCSSESYASEINGGRLSLAAWFRLCAEDLGLRSVELEDKHIGEPSAARIAELTAGASRHGLEIVNIALMNNFGLAQSNEIEFQSGTDTYIVQDFYLGVVFVKKGDWTNVIALKKPIDISLLSDPIAVLAVKLADQQGRRINMESLHLKEAQVRNLGYPRTSDFRFSCLGETYVGQLFTIGIVYTREKDENEVGFLPYP